MLTFTARPSEFCQTTATKYFYVDRLARSPSYLHAYLFRDAHRLHLCTLTRTGLHNDVIRITMVRKLTAATGKSIFNKASQTIPPRSSALSAELVEDSDSESDSSSTSTNLVSTSGNQTGNSSSSEESSAGTDTSNEVDKSKTHPEETSAKGGHSQVNGLKRKKSSVSDGSLVSESASEAVSKKPRLHDHSANRPKDGTTEPPLVETSASANASIIPARDYIPPQGFQAVSMNEAALLKPASLRGKKIWHIAMPPDVPITSLTSLELRDLQEGTLAFRHNGMQYKVTRQPTHDHQSVLLPSEQGFMTVKEPIENSYTFCATLNTPAIAQLAPSRGAGSTSAADIATAAIMAIRPQPKGLRMRYHPPGANTRELEVIGSSSDEGEQPPQATFQFPRVIGGHTGDGNGEPIDVSQHLKKKKRKHMESATVDTKTSGSKSWSQPVEASSRAQNSRSRSEDIENRAKRKAEKKTRKLAKLQARELAADPIETS